MLLLALAAVYAAAIVGVAVVTRRRLPVAPMLLTPLFFAWGFVASTTVLVDDENGVLVFLAGFLTMLAATFVAGTLAFRGHFDRTLDGLMNGGEHTMVVERHGAAAVPGGDAGSVSWDEYRSR